MSGKNNSCPAATTLNEQKSITGWGLGPIMTKFLLILFFLLQSFDAEKKEQLRCFFATSMLDN